MDQLTDILRARQAPSEGVRALLSRLDQAGGAPAAAAAAAAATPPLAPSSSSSSFGVDVAIHGPGASGSTHLANFLHREAGLRCNLLVDPDGARHAPWPPPPPQEPPPSAPPLCPSLVYLYSGDPLLAVASFYRRGIAAEQALKTTGAAALASAPVAAAAAGADAELIRARARAALRLAASGARGPSSGVQAGFPATLDAFLARGEDIFCLDAHLRAWLTLPAAGDVLFLRYEAAFEPGVARGLFRRLLAGARKGRRRRREVEAGRRGGGEAAAGRGDDDDKEESLEEVEEAAGRLAREWCAQRRDRRTRLTAEQRAQGRDGALFAGYLARVASLPHGGCFVRPAVVVPEAVSGPSPEIAGAWEPL